MVVRKMRTKKEIKEELSKYINECVILEKELDNYRNECDENGLIPEYEITNHYQSQIDVLSLKIYTLQWVLNE